MRYAIAILPLLLLVACSDPTTNFTAAKVGDAREVTKEQGKTLTFSNDNSKVEFLSGKVTADHKGGFTKFTGAVVTGDDGKSIKQIEVEIDMDHIWTDDPKKDNSRLTGHLKTGDFFLVSEYPTSKFISTEVKAGDGGAYTITGNLTMRGQTKSVTFPATIAADDGKVKARAEFKINRHDWGVSFKGKEDDLVRDHVAMILEINAG
ncbi:MAG: YceI family protein [Planctomycetes bacterium]|nr:YceI family protein [Planctomycetota bacterium]MCW8136666.1 YceI family protein [Planctomycetota bacterium]